MNRRWVLTLLAVLSVLKLCIAQTVQYTDTTYYDDNGKTIKSVVDYRIIQNDTIKTGPAVYYFTAGGLWQKGFHKNDKFDSLWTIYYPNGHVSNEKYYK
jgi:antitoxin component YwqK of YwqJK toxin-antitoxin module